MKIGIDFDDTIVDQLKDIVDILNKKRGYNIKFRDITHWKWLREEYPITKEELLTEIYDYNPCWCQPTDSRIAKYFNLISAEHIVDVVTARIGPPYLPHLIYDTLIKFGLKHIHNLIIVKNTWKQDLKYDVLVDDHPLMTENVIANGNNVKIILYTQPWNKYIDCDKYENVYRAKNWRQVYEIIKSL